MKCKICGGKAVAEASPEKCLALCAPCYVDWFPRFIAETIRKFRMFAAQDRLLVAVSGGKDSLAVWEVLCRLGYAAEGLHVNLSIGAEHGYSSASQRHCEELAARLGKALHVVDLKQRHQLEIGDFLDMKDRPVCSCCGTFKRHFMNAVAVERGADVLVTGHNMDDECATLLGNVLRWDLHYLSRQAPVLPARTAGQLVRKVKPLCHLTERETTQYAILRGIPYVRAECPFSTGATTISGKHALDLLENRSPGTKRRFYDGYLKNSAVFRPPEAELEQAAAELSCVDCGMPSAHEVCGSCRLVRFMTERKAQGQTTGGRRRRRRAAAAVAAAAMQAALDTGPGAP